MKKCSTYFSAGLLLCLLAASMVLRAQTNPAYQFQFYNASHGLPSAEIMSLAKDEKGFLWIGTADGLCRYDGYRFQHWLYSSDHFFTGSINVIRSGKNGEVWIGAGSGLFCFTGNRLEKRSAESTLPQGVNDIRIDAKGGMWLATENGPAFINPDQVKQSAGTKIVVEKSILSSWKRSQLHIDNRRANIIAAAADGTVFVAQKHFLLRVNSAGLDTLYNSERPADAILSLFPVNKSTIYFDCALTEMHLWSNGRCCYLPRDVLYKPGHSASSAVWYAGTSGVFLFDPLLGTISAGETLLDKGVNWPTAVTNDGDVLWVGTHDGLLKLQPNPFHIVDTASYPQLKELYSVLRLKNGALIAGANRGRLWQMNESGVRNYLGEEKTLVSRAEVKCLLQDKRGWLWAGTGYQGLVLYRNGTVENYTEEKDGLHDNTIECLAEMPSGHIIAGGDHGATEITVLPDGKLQLRPYFHEASVSKHARIYSVFAAPGGTVWMAGEEGLGYIDKGNFKRYRLNRDILSVRSVKLDGDGNVWMATAGAGIMECRFKGDTGLVISRQYTIAEGTGSMLYAALLVTKDDNVWAAGSGGLTLIARSGAYKNRILNFTADDGFLKPGYGNISLYQDTSGVIWVATSQGMASFDPMKLYVQDTKPRIYLSSLQFSKTGTEISAVDSLIQQSLNQSLAFTYNNNSLLFKYAAVDFAYQSSVRYYYRLDGLDTAWINAGTNRIAAWQNLEPGNYVFRVKAVNDKGIWSEKELVLTFSILPPFWQTWWFRIPGLLLIGLIITAFIRRKERRAAMREAEKTEMEKLRASSYRYQLEIEQVINFFAASISSRTGIDDILWDVARNCIAKLGFEDCVIYLFDENRNVLVQKAAWGPKTTEENKIVNPIEIKPGDGIVGAVALSGVAEVVNDTQNDSRYIIDDASRMSEITVPIRSGEKVLGVIDSEHSQKNFYTSQHLQILNTIASLLGERIVKMQAEQQAYENEIELLKLNKDLATWQITALRAQMNPHFIFNAMNSIQQFTLKHDSNNASRYISKFSSLLRKVLHSSQQSDITVEEEMAQISLYLEIEKLRMGDEFSFTVEADEEMETDAVRIPAMLVQPFVENAVKHGLPLKEGAKQLKVLFAMHDENHVQVIVEDNGVGRKRAAAIKEQQTLMPHESKGMMLVKERLQLLESEFTGKAGFEVEDLPDDKGTRIILLMPVM